MNQNKRVIYQIYPKSFMDSNGDGLGDLRGICQKIPYLKELGVDMVRISPFFKSPQKDNGYDIADYLSVDPIYGTNEDLDFLIGEFKKAGIDLMFDMVFNHTSVDHIRFQKALAGDKKYQDFYYIRPPKEDGSLPNNRTSKFGGPARKEFGDTGNYYLCLYDKSQADLNRANPDLRKEVYKIINYRLERGIKGLRFDVLNVIGKDQALPDSSGDIEEEKKLYTDTPVVHEYIREMKRETFGKYDDVVTVGEMSSTDIENSSLYGGRETGELSMVFNFHHLKVDYQDGEKWTDAPFDFLRLKEILNARQVGMDEKNATNALFWNNHDQPRANSRFADPINYPFESATLLAQTIQLMKGVVFIYQGEEIGMTNPNFKSIDQYRDVESKNNYEILLKAGKSPEEALKIIGEKSRDDSRTPLQWTGGEEAGFTTGRPWIDLAENYGEVNAEKNLSDENSIFAYYQKLIKLRKEEDIISDGKYLPILEKDPQVFAYLRELGGEKLINLNNRSDKEAEVDLSEILDDPSSYSYLLGNYGEREAEKIFTLRPYEAVCLIKRDKK